MVVCCVFVVVVVDDPPGPDDDVPLNDWNPEGVPPLLDPEVVLVVPEMDGIPPFEMDGIPPFPDELDVVVVV